MPEIVCRQCQFWSPIPSTRPGGHCLAGRKATVTQPEGTCVLDPPKAVLAYSEELKEREK